MNLEQKDKETQRKIENTLGKFKELKQLYKKESECINELTDFIKPLFKEVSSFKEKGKPFSLNSCYSFVIDNTTHHIEKGAGKEEIKTVLELVAPELKRLNNSLLDISVKLESKVKRLETLTGTKREEFFDE